MEENDMKEIIYKKNIDFIKEHIDTLCNLSFTNIEDKDIANPMWYGLDGDRTNLAYVIYSLLYKDKIPLEAFGKNYEGDTINTANTLFGRKKYRCIVENKFEISNDNELLQKISDFEKKYQTIGNFYFLPCAKWYRSLNRYRAKISWNDFFYIFLLKLDSVFKGDCDDSQFLKIIDLNSYFFDDLLENKTLESFCDFFFLQDYYEQYEELSNFFNENAKDKYWWNKNQSDSYKKDYKQFCSKYIDISINLIDKRAKRIIQELKKSL